jgi:precorrin-8X/cobalt-precorrin-8 methylmutase
MIIPMITVAIIITIMGRDIITTTITITIITARSTTTTIRRIPTPTIRMDPAAAIPRRRSRGITPVVPALPPYLRDPAAIYRESFAIIRREAALDGLPPALAAVAVRLIHACGMVDIAGDLAWGGDPVGAGQQALARGAAVFCDSAMVAAGLIRRSLPAGNPVRCTLDDPAVPALAERLATTRSAAAVALWGEELAGAVVAIGNAPTALFALLERLAAGGPRPAVILAFPVGFVGAAESKEALIAGGRGIPFLALRGRRGGSGLAAAAVNALARPEETAG